jgi:[acyl-carrier-protein] S-malonyltransferase
MASRLCNELPRAKSLFDTASDILGYNLLTKCTEGPEAVLNSTAVAQPAIFVSSIAALEMLKSQDPDALGKCTVAMGLSLGEYSALCFAGAISFEDGVKLTKSRGLAMQAASDAQRSGMVAITGLSAENVHAACKAAEEKCGLPISIGNYLMEGNYVVSGAAEACNVVKDIAMAMGARSTAQLPVAGAFHTAFMQPAVAQLTAALREVEIISPRIPVISNVDAKAHAGPEAIRDALVKQLVAPVQWETTMKNMLLAPEFEQCYEIGPGSVCKGLVMRFRKRAKVVSVLA